MRRSIFSAIGSLSVVIRFGRTHVAAGGEDVLVLTDLLHGRRVAEARHVLIRQASCAGRSVPRQAW